MWKFMLGYFLGFLSSMTVAVVGMGFLSDQSPPLGGVNLQALREKFSSISGQASAGSPLFQQEDIQNAIRNGLYHNKSLQAAEELARSEGNYDPLLKARLEYTDYLQENGASKDALEFLATTFRIAQEKAPASPLLEKIKDQLSRLKGSE